MHVGFFCESAPFWIGFSMRLCWWASSKWRTPREGALSTIAYKQPLLERSKGQVVKGWEGSWDPILALLRMGGFLFLSFWEARALSLEPSKWRKRRAPSSADSPSRVAAPP